MKKSLAKTFALGLGLSLGVGAIVALAPSEDVPSIETTSTSAPSPITSIVEGELELEPTLPQVTPTPKTPESDTTCHEEDPCWDPQTMGNGLGSLPETTPESDRTASPTAPQTSTAYVEPPTASGSTLFGLLVGDVIVCAAGLEVSIDVTPAGTAWVSCF